MALGSPVTMVQNLIIWGDPGRMDEWVDECVQKPGGLLFSFCFELQRTLVCTP